MIQVLAANWKMHKTNMEAQDYVLALENTIKNTCSKKQYKVLLFPPFTCLSTVGSLIRQNTVFELGAQNFYPADNGAFTGETSVTMLKELGVAWVLVGHSERRHFFGENFKLVQEKLAFALKNGLKVILCVGETLEERNANQLENVLEKQLSCLSLVENIISVNDITIAYEPVWAIGTGRVADEKEIMEAHAIVRKILQSIFKKTGIQVPILYGGSVNTGNASLILGLDNVDGVLVGGASLQVEDFPRIIKA